MRILLPSYSLFSIEIWSISCSWRAFTWRYFRKSLVQSLKVHIIGSWRLLNSRWSLFFSHHMPSKSKLRNFDHLIFHEIQNSFIHNFWWLFDDHAWVLKNSSLHLEFPFWIMSFWQKSLKLILPLFACLCNERLWIFDDWGHSFASLSFWDTLILR